MISKKNHLIPNVLPRIIAAARRHPVRYDAVRCLNTERSSPFAQSAIQTSTFISTLSSNSTATLGHLHATSPVSASRSVAFFSSSATKKDESSGGITGWMNSRREKQQREKYVEQMEKLANMDRLTMKEYHGMLEEGVSGFMTNISFLQTSEVKMAKAVVEVVEKIIDVVGPDATADDLIEMDRLQRLKVSTAANKTPEEIGIMVSQITNMDVMQKALRKRKLEGKKIPQDQDQMQAIIKRDALQVMSKSQKNMMKSRQENYAKRMARRKAGR